MTYMQKPKTTMNKRKMGAHYEQLAADYLCQQGYRILEYNYRCKCGEIDLIAEKEGYTIFIEVKYRAKLRFGYPREAVTFYKRQHIMHTASYYLLTHFGVEKACRFDVIEILENQLTHIKAAF